MNDTKTMKPLNAKRSAPLTSCLSCSSQQSHARRRRLGVGLLCAVLAAFTAWASGYIWRTSFVIDGRRYFCLFDDAMVSMRYGMNLARGSGLVWNPGADRVEGYTNPLWTLVMGAVHITGVPSRLASLSIQVAGLGLLLANIICVYGIAFRLSASQACALVAAFLAAFYLPLNTWGLQGMEVALLVLLVDLSVFLLLRSQPGPPSLRVPFALLALGILTRPDAVVSFLAVLGWGVACHPGMRRRILQCGGGILLATVLGVTIARWCYYREWAPNTYYLKMSGVSPVLRVLRGGFAFRDFVETMGLLCFLLPLVFAAVNVRSRGVALLAVLLGGQITYSIYVGGDAWEWYGHYANRYLCVGMPCFFVLLAMTLQRVIASCPHAQLETSPRRWERHAAFLLLAGSGWLAVHGAIPGWKLTMFARALALRDLPLHVANNAKHTIAGLWLKNVCPPNVLLATHWAGSAPYFSRLAAVDLLGKSDKRVARARTGAATWRDVYPGHDKHDYAYSLGVLKPDVIITPFLSDIQGWDYELVDAMEDVCILARRGSELAKTLAGRERKASDLYAATSSAWPATASANSIQRKAVRDAADLRR